MPKSHKQCPERCRYAISIETVQQQFYRFHFVSSTLLSFAVNYCGFYWLFFLFFYSFCASFLQSPCTAVCLSFDMTSLSSDKWERRPHKNSDVLYRWHWDSLFRFFIFFFVFVKLCHFLAVVFLSLRRCSPVCRASWRKKKTRSVIMFGDSCHSLFSCPLSYFSFRTACLVMETSFISGS